MKGGGHGRNEDVMESLSQAIGSAGTSREDAQSAAGSM